MKKINQVLLLLILPLMLELVISCCDCIDTTFLNYTNCSLAIDNLDNSGPVPLIASSDSIPKEAYGVRISISRSENFCELRRRNSFFIQSAYATSCRCPPEYQFMPLDSMVSLEIITAKDFNETHQAGSDITELFYVFEENEFTGINAYIKTMENKLLEHMNPVLVLDILLMSPPEMGTDHQFKITITLSDGRILTEQTGVVKLI